MVWAHSVQFSSVAQLCPTLCDPMDCSTPGVPVHYQLMELTQTHVHWVGDIYHPTISSSVVPFSSLLQSFPASGSFPMGQFFTGVSASASVLPMNIQDWFPWCSTISFLIPLVLLISDGEIFSSKFLDCTHKWKFSTWISFTISF